ncbi:MAG: glutamine-hydrolyzing GMP synthase [Gammaproteobacteria bacterium]|nr:glutamine-hydrolyzing GMP synthase [Gammaproteobacteria bacterium]
MTTSAAADIHAQRLLILDYGSQYTQLIARRVREIGVYCEIFPFDSEQAAGFAQGVNGIILSGGPESVALGEAPAIPDYVLASNCPVLGICYGMQVMAATLGGTVESSDHREFGFAQIEIKNASPLFADLKDKVNAAGVSCLDVWMSHGDKVTQLPDGFEVLASSPSAEVAAMADQQRQWYGLQFHPEVTHSKQGREIISHFLLEICGCDPLWNAGNIAQELITQVQEKVGQEHVILGLSGGVDSSVVAALLHKAIGKQLTCIFVDNGLLRLHEGDQVMKTFAEHLGVNVIRVNAQKRFLNALAGQNDPELKRKIIGNLFVEVFEEEAAKITDARWLAQGTIYPDVIESAGASTGKAHLIKSHHNVGGLPDDMQLKLVEPLRELFKDEVRRLGGELGLPAQMIHRHPFPGPGLAVRILGEVKQEFADILRLADNIFIKELEAHDLYDEVSQAFAVFLPVKSVGVTGDGRRYQYVISLRAVETIDFMTARWAHLPYDFLDLVSRRIINEIENVSRVTYDISSKPPATIEWE